MKINNLKPTLRLRITNCAPNKVSNPFFTCPNKVSNPVFNKLKKVGGPPINLKVVS